MKFAYKLQELRKGCGMSQEELAELLGVSRQSVSKWESGKGYPEIEKLIFISHYFNTSLDLLLKDNEEPSTPISTKSTKSTRVSKKRKNSIKLTKPEDVPQSATNDTTYASDPMPTKSHENLSLKRVSVAPNAQIGTFKSYQFGSSTAKRRKVSKNAKRCIALACLFVASIVGIVGYTLTSNQYSYEDWGSSTVAVTYYEDVVEADSYGDWSNLYDEDFTSESEQYMLQKVNTQETEQLITSDGKVYYSGYDIVNVYINAQLYMRMDLDCYALYEKYLSLQNSGKYVDVYSESYGSWVIMPKELLMTYVSQSESVPYNVPNTSLEYDDIYTDTDYYSDMYDYAPVENVSYAQSNAVVSTDILNLCIQAMDERKQDLNMKQYVQEFENLESKYPRVFCTDRCDDDSLSCFVPKEFIMVNLSDYDEISNDDDSEIIQEVVIEDIEQSDE